MSDETFDREVTAIAANWMNDLPGTDDASPGEPIERWLAVEVSKLLGKLLVDAAWCRRSEVLHDLVRLGALAKVAHAHLKKKFDAQTGRG